MFDVLIVKASFCYSQLFLLCVQQQTRLRAYDEPRGGFRAEPATPAVANIIQDRQIGCFFYFILFTISRDMQ